MIFADDGMDGIKKAEVYNPDLILLDILMPKMSGFKTCRLIKENGKTNNIPIIMLTSLDKVGDAESAFKCGADEYITKPIEAKTFPNKLQRKYKKILEERKYL